MGKTITSAERRYLDYVRRNGVQTSNGWARRLASLRMKEVTRLTNILRTYDDVAAWENVIRMELSERAYMPQWYRGLIVNGGLPMVGVTSRQLTGDPKALDKAPFERGLADYADRRAGNEIRIVSGTMKDNLVGIVRKNIAEDMNIGAEKLAKAVHDEFGKINLWQARRIAQTEMMGALAEAGRESAQVLDIRFTKQWCCSGLANTRETHLMMDGVEADENEMFVLGDCAMEYPHDMTNGTAGEVINCACSCIRRPKY